VKCSEFVSEATSSDEKAADSEVQLPIKAVTATVEQANYSAASSIDGKLETGWAIDDGRSIPTTAEATFSFDEDQLNKGLLKLDSAKGGVGLRIRLVQNHGARHVLGAFRLAVGKSLSSVEQEARRSELVEKKFEEWRNDRSRKVVAWTPLKPLAATSNLPHLTILEDASILASGDTTKQDRYEIIWAHRLSRSRHCDWRRCRMNDCREVVRGRLFMKDRWVIFI
jgi:hypothetical protein